MQTRKQLWLLRAKYIKLHVVECKLDLNNASYLSKNFENILKNSRNKKKKLLFSFENYLDHTFLVKTVEDVLPTKVKAFFLLFHIWALNWCIKYFRKQSIRKSNLAGWFCFWKQCFSTFCVVCQADHTLAHLRHLFWISLRKLVKMPLAVTVTWQYRLELFIMATNQ